MIWREYQQRGTKCFVQAMSHVYHSNTSGQSEGCMSHKKLLAGSILAMTSSLLFTTNGVILKRLKLNYSDVNLVRYFLQIVVMFSVMKLKNMRIIKQLEQESCKQMKENKMFATKILLDDADPVKRINCMQGLLIFQGICNGLSGLGEAITMTFMPIGDASAIVLSSPLPFMLLARVFLQEILGLYKIICGLVLCLGVILVLQPPFLFDYFRRCVYLLFSVTFNLSYTL